MKRPASPPRRQHGRLIVVLLLMATTAVLLFAVAAAGTGAPPRSLAPYLQHRLAGHHPMLTGAGEWLAQLLNGLDRGEPRTANRLTLRIGAQSETMPSSTVIASKLVFVNSAQQAVQAIENVRPGDVITFEPGTYRFEDRNIAARQGGTRDAPITVRADRPGTVVLEMQVSEGFVVSAPYWTFENLTIRGICAQHDDCEHAFHVVGGATNFVARNNTLVDFNAHIKVNGQGRRFPDDGIVEGNTITNSGARQTANPVAPIDLVGVNGWVVRANLITDFVKAQGDRISYGAFAKGGGTGNRFERNAVVCEYRLRGKPGWRVGLSLGGGGSGKDYCRDRDCAIEHEGGVIESNLISSCSDDGIYLNRAAMSRIVHNTLLDTGGIVVRFAQSSADVEGNLVDGALRSRDDGLIRANDNLHTDLAWLYLGRHPERSWYRDPLALDLAWSGPPPRRGRASESPTSADLCGAQRPTPAAYGAFEDFAACLGGTAKSFNAP